LAGKFGAWFPVMMAYTILITPCPNDSNNWSTIEVIESLIFMESLTGCCCPEYHLKGTHEVTYILSPYSNRIIGTLPLS
jgi:hypothetical protein